MLEKILEDEARYEVEIARSGFMAGITAEKFKPHVILLDMHLKDIDGPRSGEEREGGILNSSSPRRSR